MTTPRTLRLTIHGSICPVLTYGFVPHVDWLDDPAGSVVRIPVPTGRTCIYMDATGERYVIADETPEQVLTLWNAAAPTPEPVVDRWETWTTSGEHPSDEAPTHDGYVAVGPWFPFAATDASDIWRRPLRRVQP